MNRARFSPDGPKGRRGSRTSRQAVGLSQDDHGGQRTIAEVKRAEQTHLSCSAVTAVYGRSAVLPNGASIFDEALLTIVIQGPTNWP
jgi:hypothetical protein